MKSIVEEATSIEKAITQAWTRAGKPQKFTITVFQEPEKNFFGMTTAKAKIGFMFDERSMQQKTQKRPAAKPRSAQVRPQKKQERSASQERQERTVNQERSERPRHTEAPQKKASSAQKNDNRFWSEEMVESARSWLNEALKIMNKDSIQFSAKPNRYHLKVQLSKPLADDAKEEKAIFRSFAHLIMQAQRSAFKKAFKHHKVILTSS